MNIILIDLSQSPSKNLGLKTIGISPQVGEWIELDHDKSSAIYEILTIVHKVDRTTEVYVRYLGHLPELIRQRFSVGQSFSLERWDKCFN
ncbi:hypothetical protein ABLT94_01585 [Acinetobacter soli]